MRVCSAKTAKGEPCRGYAMAESDVCSAHAGVVGRRLTMTEEIVSQILVLLRQGNYIGTVCQAVGLPRRTFGEWMARGKSDSPDDSIYVDFREQVTQARAVGEARSVASIVTASKDDWKAAAWLLERQYPERWGKTSVRMRDEAPPEPEAEVAPEDDPFAEVDELAERRAGRTG